MATSDTTAARPGLPAFRNHPRGLVVLCLTQMWERFSFYGMRALLVLYLTEELLRPERAGQVLGYGWLRGGLESVFGPMTIQAMSSQIYGLYGGLVFLTPLIGGLVADRYLGQRRAVFIGGALIALGHILMAFDATFLLALVAIIVGSGLFTPAISAQVGALYAAGDDRRDTGYSLFYVGINIGATAAPLICGTVGETLGWHLGFSLAAAGMIMGLAGYAAGARWLPPEAPPTPPAPPTPGVRFPLAAMLGIMAVSSLFWAAYGQLGNVMNFWLRDDSDLSVFSGFALKITWFQSLNPLFILLGTPLVVALWARMARRGREPSTLVKVALGCAFLAAAFWLLAGVAAVTAGGGKAHWSWTVLSIALLTLGELYLAPPSWSLFSRLAPRGRETLFMGLWLLPLFVGGYLSGLVGVFWETTSHEVFWLLVGGLSAIGAAATLVLRRFLAPVASL
ncbi:MAG: peptide MFS transporter [Caulobacteraceae bacterium]|nr:peptide MFS transporter [Caulobacteraceae bacterium]